MRSYVKPITCFFIAIVMGILFIEFMTPPIRNDAGHYHRRGMVLMDKDIVDMFTHRFPHHEPVYPIFLGICFKMFGGSDNAVRFVQVILSAFTSLIVYSLASQFYGKNIGFISSLLYSFCPSFAYYPTFFLTETLAVFLFTFSYWLTMRSIRTENVLIAICAGLFLSIALLTKYPFLFFGVFVMSLWALFNGPGYYLRRKFIVIMLIIGLLPIILFFIWSSLNKGSGAKDDYRLTKTLMYSMSEIALTQREQIARIVGLVSRNLGERIFPSVNYRDVWPVPRKKIAELDKESNEKYANLRSKNDRWLSILSDLFREHPYRYALSRLSVLMRLNAFQYPSRLNETDRWKDFYNRKSNKSLLIIFGDIILKLLSNPVCWFLIGLLIIKTKKIPMMPIILPVLYINLAYFLLEGIPRLALPALPFYLVGGGVMVFYVLKIIERRFSFLRKPLKMLTGNEDVQEGSSITD